MARTYNSINAFLLAIIAALSIGFVSACQNTARGLEQDAAEAEADTRDERAKARDAARGFANDAADAARVVGAIAADAGEEVAERASAVKERVDVKSALMADSSVDASGIDVNVSAWTRTVTLNGHVPTAGEREKAESIARQKAEGYKVVNNITVQHR
ncbi:MAG TPA: BON domain-containing protein [Vicinamibacterales bacterium]|nr:BON domain-containing protein [Vicinamibacterales bacterium]